MSFSLTYLALKVKNHVYFFCSCNPQISVKCLALEQFRSVPFSCSVVSDSLQPHGLQHARPPCPSPTPRVYPNLCPLSQWCHPTISSSVVPFSLSPLIFPSIRVFSDESAVRIRWPKYWNFSFNSSPSNEHPGMISLGWTDLIYLLSKGLSGVFSNITVQKRQSLALSFLYSPTLTSIHDYWKNHSLD